ncbi:MAG: hypothetical protein COA52_00435 [Hyphomicrobiales bacterium]|nr:MAG: hypothetical protein COA52_00435 [Hyphomicrobiales bacterium]
MVRDDIDKIYSSDPFYDLFYGGYIRADLAKPEYRDELQKSIDMVLEFIEELEKEGHLESDS